MTTEQILVKWIVSKAQSNRPFFYSYELEEGLPTYGRLAFQRQHSASTYSRTWRKLREGNKLQRLGYKLEEIVHDKSAKVKGWKIIKDS